MLSNNTGNPGVPVVTTVTPSATPLIKPLDQSMAQSNINSMPDNRKKGSPLMMVIPVLVILLGVGMGYLLTMMPSKASDSSNSSASTLPGASGDKATNDSNEEGINDAKLFPDVAQGVLEANDGTVTKEGTHRLVRPGGADQTAYLTSSVVELDKYVGKKVEIRGQTNTAQKAGWLMEVGYIKIVQ